MPVGFDEPWRTTALRKSAAYLERARPLPENRICTSHATACYCMSRIACRMLLHVAACRCMLHARPLRGSAPTSVGCGRKGAHRPPSARAHRHILEIGGYRTPVSKPSPGADVAGVSPVPAQMWHWNQSPPQTPHPVGPVPPDHAASLFRIASTLCAAASNRGGVRPTSVHTA